MKKLTLEQPLKASEEAMGLAVRILNDVHESLKKHENKLGKITPELSKNTTIYGAGYLLRHMQDRANDDFSKFKNEFQFIHIENQKEIPLSEAENIYRQTSAFKYPVLYNNVCCNSPFRGIIDPGLIEWDKDNDCFTFPENQRLELRARFTFKVTESQFRKYEMLMQLVPIWNEILNCDVQENYRPQGVFPLPSEYLIFDNKYRAIGFKTNFITRKPQPALFPKIKENSVDNLRFANGVATSWGNLTEKAQKALDNAFGPTERK